MNQASKSTADDPFTSPTGEKIYELLSSKNLSLALVEVEPGDSSPKHVHHELTEIYIIKSGQMRLVVNGVETVLKEGDAVVIEPGDIHQLFNDGPETLEFWVPTGPAWHADDYHIVDS